MVNGKAVARDAGFAAWMRFRSKRPTSCLDWLASITASNFVRDVCCEKKPCHASHVSPGYTASGGSYGRREPCRYHQRINAGGTGVRQKFVEFLKRKGSPPSSQFLAAVDEFIDQHPELLRRLAQ